MKCPRCGNAVPDNEMNCSRCGYFISTNENRDDKNHQKINKIIIIVVVGLIFIGLILYILINRDVINFKSLMGNSSINTYTCSGPGSTHIIKGNLNEAILKEDGVYYITYDNKEYALNEHEIDSGKGTYEKNVYLQAQLVGDKCVSTSEMKPSRGLGYGGILNYDDINKKVVEINGKDYKEVPIGDSFVDISTEVKCPSGYTVNEQAKNEYYRCVKVNKVSKKKHYVCTNTASSYGWHSVAKNLCAKYLKVSRTKKYSCSFRYLISGYKLKGNQCVKGKYKRLANVKYGKCPSGYATKGNTCTKTITKKMTLRVSCPSGYAPESNYCVKKIYKKGTVKEVCPSGYIEARYESQNNDEKLVTHKTCQKEDRENICPTGYLLTSFSSLTDDGDRFKCYKILGTGKYSDLKNICTQEGYTLDRNDNICKKTFTYDAMIVPSVLEVYDNERSILKNAIDSLNILHGENVGLNTNAGAFTYSLMDYNNLKFYEDNIIKVGNANGMGTGGTFGIFGKNVGKTQLKLRIDLSEEGGSVLEKTLDVNVVPAYDIRISEMPTSTACGMGGSYGRYVEIRKILADDSLNRLSLNKATSSTKYISLLFFSYLYTDNDITYRSTNEEVVKVSENKFNCNDYAAKTATVTAVNSGNAKVVACIGENQEYCQTVDVTVE